MSLLQDSSLLLTPNAYKEGKLYSVIPSNGNGDFTATRATTATRVNAAGLVDLVPYNLVSWSEMFSDASWTKSNVTISPNSISAPNGFLTADTLTGNGVSGSHGILNGFTPVISTTYTLSCYVKADTNNFIQITAAASAFGSSFFANFDIANGVVGNYGAPVLNPTIENAGDGWYRVSVSAVALTGVNVGAIGIYLISSNTSVRLETNTLTTSIFIWGAQLVEGTSARDYLRTETRLNIPRVDYSLGGCPNLLLEPQRTNLALQSSSFDSATWTKTASSVTANATTSPSGIVDADKLIPSTLLGAHSVLQAFSIASSAVYTASVYAKKGEYIGLRMNYVSSGNTNVSVNLETGVISGASGTAYLSSSITNVDNGWYRITMTFTAPVGTNTLGLIVENPVGTVNFSGDGTSGLFLWGAQLEAGAYATSFIPTTTASVTRNIDIVQATNVPSLIGQTEGTIYWEGTLTSGLDDIFYLNRSVANSVLIYKSAINNITFRIYYGAAFLNVSAAPSYTGTVRIAAAYKSGDSVMYINGVQVGTSATAFTFTGALNDVVLNNSSFFFGNQTKNVKEVALFTSRLTNQQMSMLTSGIYPTAAAAYASLGLVSESPSCLTSTTTF